MHAIHIFSMAAKKSFFGQPELGSKNHEFLSKMELCSGDRSGAEFEANILGSIYVHG